MKIEYLHSPAHSIYRDYRLVIGAGKAHAARALKFVDEDAISLHVWRNQDGWHARYSWSGLCRTVDGRAEALAEVRDFTLGRAITKGAREAIDGWFQRGARAELALVLNPVNA
ncbi:MAG: hypothetical protein KatS3mg015_2893 [Fimbriimonadales bacterium]|nr:MAG: hypothetical protein KatS3mg015_2893 [Fimbriimonadales bacterium]